MGRIAVMLGSRDHGKASKSSRKAEGTSGQAEEPHLEPPSPDAAQAPTSRTPEAKANLGTATWQRCRCTDMTWDFRPSQSDLVASAICSATPSCTSFAPLFQSRNNNNKIK
ncbi:hypothetical protein J3458_004927 [Metarhizium acridum]|uniref:uncharacterized protein n=1 Tax=Metarhizium acridum TaxID=92637 RepID=UPI001C6B26F2|nr:hypothetical protein J3458_004927 [Metarhizium acridum]